MSTEADAGAGHPYVITSRLEPQDGRQSDLVDLLRRFAVTIHAETGCLHYSIHRDPADDRGALTVVQVYSTVEAFREHAAWMRSHIPELASHLASPPAPPVLLEQVVLSGDVKESFAPPSA